MELDKQDLSFAVLRLPRKLKDLMKTKEWIGKIFIGGGYIRAIVAGEKINDIDLFVSTKELAEKLSAALAKSEKSIRRTENSFSFSIGHTAAQVIHRWVFEKPEDVANSFDFTVCCSVISFVEDTVSKALESDKIICKWISYCDDRFYIDLASKRLVYRSPIRNEDAGGSLLRVLKYYQRGYRIPLDSFGAVIARMMKDVNLNAVSKQDPESASRIIVDEPQLAKVVTGLLRVVDPNVDPLHESHLPAQDKTMNTNDDLPF